jgi:hypothetical protein
MAALQASPLVDRAAPPSDAAHLIARHRRERDLIGLIRRPNEVLFCYALPRPDGRPAAADCPVCRTKGFVEVALPRPSGTPSRVISLECPLCLGMGQVEPAYSDFSTCFQNADLHDVRAITHEDGRPAAYERLPTDRLYTLAEAHAYLMREAA